jgi:hypothetical protein
MVRQKHCVRVDQLRIPAVVRAEADRVAVLPELLVEVRFNTRYQQRVVDGGHGIIPLTL